MKRYIAILAGCVIFMLAGYLFFFRTASESETIPQNAVSSGSSPDRVPPSALDITADDVRAAGFVGTIRREMPTETMYGPPALYFRVGDVHVNQVSDLLMVSQVMTANPDEPLFSYGSSTIPFMIPDGRGQETTAIDGRTVINFIKNHEYVVIMGPVAKNIAALALIAGGKIR